VTRQQAKTSEDAIEPIVEQIGPIQRGAFLICLASRLTTRHAHPQLHSGSKYEKFFSDLLADLMKFHTHVSSERAQGGGRKRRREKKGGRKQGGEKKQDAREQRAGCQPNVNVLSCPLVQKLYPHMKQDAHFTFVY